MQNGKEDDGAGRGKGATIVYFFTSIAQVSGRFNWVLRVL
jgi:hypothetical protein